ncbi:restriction endonuclease subunit S [Paucibacter sp. APW11]|uniref:Restriction endonuclease subunit S n=1 Tax=Roseateles aquae TaxID=3077235 RepID=A0ABU3PCZ2_9BURK|nr:restriction endonuclease subunit S [Paucibacter sp. APW11]MDT9000439.1 restriction endonuclease subunit S [Paucibacter sp. APW11]
MSFELTTQSVIELVSDGVLWVEDGNHGENRPLAPEFVDQGTPFVRPDDLSNGTVNFRECDHINEAALKRIRKGKGKAGDIVFTHRATVGRIARVGAGAPDFVANPGVTVYRSKRTDVLDTNYLYYFMQAPYFMRQVWAEAGNTDTFPYVSLTQQRRLKICYPRIETQRAIGEVLGSLDDRITLLREANATLEAIAQALYKSWFVDFDPVRAKREGRPPEGMDEAIAVFFPDGFENSELGQVPKGWRTATLGDCTAYLNRGISPKYIDKGGVLVLNQKCVRDFAVDSTKARRHDPAQRKVEGRELQPGDVLVNSTGVGTLGRVAQLVELEEPSIVDSHVTVVRTNERLSWNFLGLTLMRMQPQIEQFGEGTTGQTELSRGKLAGIPLVVPPVAVVKRFDEIVVPLRKCIAANQVRAKTLAALRESLLPRLISGQLRLPPVETEIAALQ